MEISTINPPVSKPSKENNPDVKVPATSSPQEPVAFKDQLSKAAVNGEIPAVSKDLKLTEKPKFSHKGQAFVYWGYNRSAFTKSDLTFKGEGYNFTLHDVTATDKPAPLHNLSDFATYVNPSSIMVPQYNWRIGYFFDDKTSISLGHDHMKYKMPPQAVSMSGSISSSASPEFAGNYDNTPVSVGHEGDVVSVLEHCDGLNDISVELGRLEPIWVSKSGKQAISLLGAIGAGGVVTDTRAEVLNQENPHNHAGVKGFHLAGYSASATAGIQVDLSKHFFVQGKVKGGYINLKDAVTTLDGGRESQSFGFIEPMVVVGYSFNISRQ